MAAVFKNESGSLKTNINSKPQFVCVCVCAMCVLLILSDTNWLSIKPALFIGQPNFALAIKYAIKLTDDNCCFQEFPIGIAQWLNVPHFAHINWIFHKMFGRNVRFNAKMAQWVFGFVFAKHKCANVCAIHQWILGIACILFWWYFVLNAIKFHFLHSK